MQKWENTKNRDVPPNPVYHTPPVSSIPNEKRISSQVIVKHSKIFSSALGHSGAHWRKLNFKGF